VVTWQVKASRLKMRQKSSTWCTRWEWRRRYTRQTTTRYKNQWHKQTIDIIINSTKGGQRRGESQAMERESYNYVRITKREDNWHGNIFQLIRKAPMDPKEYSARQVMWQGETNTAMSYNTLIAKKCKHETLKVSGTRSITQTLQLFVR